MLTKITPEKALEKMMSYCSKMERSEFDVKKKMSTWGLSTNDVSHIIEKLQDYGFIDSQRYIMSYVRGKFNYNKWGKTKIRYNLSLRGFKDSVIDNAFSEFFSTIDYEKVIEEQLRQKNKSLKVEDDFQRKAKLIQFGQSRGYELNILLLCCDKILNKK